MYALHQENQRLEQKAEELESTLAQLQHLNSLDDALDSQVRSKVKAMFTIMAHSESEVLGLVEMLWCLPCHRHNKSCSHPFPGQFSQVCF